MSAVYLLDTCTVSDFVKGEQGVMARIKGCSPALLAVSAVTRMEIAYGLALAPERGQRWAGMLDAFFSVVTTLPFETADAQAAGMLRADLRTKGQPIGAYDVLIAATSLRNGLVVVTSNLGEFNRIAGLRVENWRL